MAESNHGGLSGSGLSTARSLSSSSANAIVMLSTVVQGGTIKVSMAEAEAGAGGGVKQGVLHHNHNHVLSIEQLAGGGSNSMISRSGSCNAGGGAGGGLEVNHNHNQNRDYGEYDYDAIMMKKRMLLGKGLRYWLLMVVSVLTLLAGSAIATILGRFYFMHGGSRRWLYTCVQSAGWPANLPPLLLCYWLGRRPTRLTWSLGGAYVGMGLLTAFDNLLFSWGLSYLPLSTNTLLCASQLAFNALFSRVVVGQRLTPYTTNAIFSITMGAVLLGVYAGADRPEGTTRGEYALGFVVTLAGSALYALMLPLMELIYEKLIGCRASGRDFAVVVESQTAISVVATGFSLCGMWATGDFAAIQHEARVAFDVGGITGYTLTLVGSAVGWQWFFVGGAGIIFLGSSLLSCVCMTTMLPLLSLLSVLFLHDRFSALKGIAMLLSMWGFISYIYGGYLESKSQNAVEPEKQLDSDHHHLHVSHDHPDLAEKLHSHHGAEP